MTQHSTVTLERWRGFDKSQQILMIGNEMNRGAKLSEPEALTDAHPLWSSSRIGPCSSCR